MINQPATQASASNNWVNAHLLYMGAAVDQLDNHEPHRTACVVHTNPRVSEALVCGQFLDRQRRVVGNLGHADTPKCFSCRQLEVCQTLQISPLGKAYP